MEPFSKFRSLRRRVGLVGALTQFLVPLLSVAFAVLAGIISHRYFPDVFVLYPAIVVFFITLAIFAGIETLLYNRKMNRLLARLQAQGYEVSYRFATEHCEYLFCQERKVVFITFLQASRKPILIEGHQIQQVDLSISEDEYDKIRAITVQLLIDGKEHAIPILWLHSYRGSTNRVTRISLEELEKRLAIGDKIIEQLTFITSDTFVERTPSIPSSQEKIPSGGFRIEIIKEQPPEFDREVLAQLASLLSNGQPDIVREVRESIDNFDDYTSIYTSGEDFTNEEYWERWYPNSKPDPAFLAEYVDDKPTFCSLNMLEWLADKGYVAYGDAAWECDELTAALNSLAKKQDIPIDFAGVGLLADDEESRVVFTDENLKIAGRALQPYGYQLLNIDRDGDCYDLAIVSKKIYQQMVALDLASFAGNLGIVSYP